MFEVFRGRDYRQLSHPFLPTAAGINATSRSIVERPTFIFALQAGNWELGDCRSIADDEA